MGKSITPTYRIEVTDTAPRGTRNTMKMCWEGKASLAKLEEWVRTYAGSLEAGGVNEHISESIGYIPYPHSARIVHQKSGVGVCEWKAAASCPTRTHT